MRVVAGGNREAHGPQSTESVSRVVRWIIERGVGSVGCGWSSVRPRGCKPEERSKVGYEWSIDLILEISV